jgi:ubiquinol-cytochrome c reductase cytochrome b subunit
MFGASNAAGKEDLPEQVLKDTIAIFAAFIVLFVLAVAVRVPRSARRPTDTTYIPRPAGTSCPLPVTEVLHGTAGSGRQRGVAGARRTVLFRFLIDRGEVMKLTRGTYAAAVVMLAAIGWAGLTAAAVATPKPQETQIAGSWEWRQLPEELAGIGYFRQENCTSCHSVGDGGAKSGRLTRISIRKNAWMIQHFKTLKWCPAARCRRYSFLMRSSTRCQPSLKLTPQNAYALESDGVAVHGALVPGRRLRRLGERRRYENRASAERTVKSLAREWVEHFLDPQKLSPGTVMRPAASPRRSTSPAT